VFGPPDLRPKGPPDSVRVEGTGPNGEPLYGAQWYREPYDDELAGYLSTARGPGWGLIACRTVPRFRVEDCVIVGESPRGSGIANAVLQAAWQFQVRPPRVGGRDRYGEWVRIRIDYQQERPDGRAR
jgi:protein TonB